MTPIQSAYAEWQNLSKEYAKAISAMTAATNVCKHISDLEAGAWWRFAQLGGFRELRAQEGE